MQQVADAIRNVTAKMQQAIDTGQRARMIDADDLIDVLLSIADELDPVDRPHVLPEIEAGEVHPTYSCPHCGEYETKHLTLEQNKVHCQSCGSDYALAD